VKEEGLGGTAGRKEGISFLIKCIQKSASRGTYRKKKRRGGGKKGNYARKRLGGWEAGEKVNLPAPRLESEPYLKLQIATDILNEKGGVGGKGKVYQKSSRNNEKRRGLYSFTEPLSNFQQRGGNIDKEGLEKRRSQAGGPRRDEESAGSIYSYSSNKETTKKRWRTLQKR